MLSQPLTSALSLELKAESLVLERRGGRQDMKIQAKDCHQGGLFQLEPEPGVAEINMLGARLPLHAPAGRPDAPVLDQRQVQRLRQPGAGHAGTFTARIARWNVRSGGRIGGVFGEDAIEGGCPV